MDPSPIFEAQLQRVRRNRWIIALAASPFLLTLAAFIAGLTMRPALFPLMIQPTFIGTATLLLAWRKNPKPQIEEAEVRADAKGLRVGEMFVPRHEIRAAFVLQGVTSTVRIERHGRLPIALRVESAAEGRALLRALGLDASQTVATFRTGSRAVAKSGFAGGAMGAFMAVYGMLFASLVNTRFGHHPAFATAGGVTLVLAMLAMIGVLLMPTRLSVGADGIVLQWFGRARFIGYDDVTLVSRYERGWGRSRQIGVAVTLRSGEEVYIPAGFSQWSEESVSIIEERIAEGMDVFRSGGTAADAALLRRGDRGLADWVASLRAIGSGANADMRTAPMPRERLFRIVESPTAAAADRAAAAIALGSVLDADTRLRLKSAADAVAEPKLRVLLESAATDIELAELEAAMAELETHESKTKHA